MLTRIWRTTLRLIAKLPADPKARALAGHLSKYPRLAGPRNGPVLAIQCVGDPLFMAVFSELARWMAQRYEARCEIIVVRSISGAIGTGLFREFLRCAPIAWLISRQWHKVVDGTIYRVAYRSASWLHPISDIVDGWTAWGVWRRARKARGDFALEISGIEVGDLVVDSYLRFRPAPRFDVNDRFALNLVWQAHRDVRRARRYFSSRRPIAYLTSHCTYIEHGIPVRAALQAGVSVHAFGSFQAFGARLTKEHWFHTADASGYRTEFDALPDKARPLAMAEQGLSLRLSGGIDAATSYMKTSAYADEAKQMPEIRGAVVVFLHDFYDSPHVYADLVFQDFWSWIVCTLDTLEAGEVPFFLKPHPNQVDLSNEALAELKRKYPNVRFLSPRASNVQLVEAGMLCGVTVYGTVAHELAYLGIPSIACARHPHHSFSFCRTARSVEQYQALLRSPSEHPLSTQEMRRQALAFYYMHNLHGSEEELELRRRFVEFWKASHDPAISPSEWIEMHGKLTHSAGFVAFVDALTLH